MNGKRPDEVIKKTYTCELPGGGGCSNIYGALTTPEFEWFEKLSKIEQEKFEKKLLDEHIKTCFRKQDHAKGA